MEIRIFGRLYRTRKPSRDSNSDLNRSQDLITDGKLTIGEDDTILLSQDQLERIIDLCRGKYAQGWSKEFREMPSAKLYQELISYMSGFSLLERLNDQELRFCLRQEINGRYLKTSEGRAVAKKWIINRIGLINFWYYDEEEFQFSGDSYYYAGPTDREVRYHAKLYPLLLDGNKSGKAIPLVPGLGRSKTIS